MPRLLPAWALLFSFSFLPAQHHSEKKVLSHVVEGQKKAWIFPLEKKSWTSYQSWLLLGVCAGSLALDGSVSQNLRDDPSWRTFNQALDSRAVTLLLGTLPVALAGGGKLTGHPGLTEYGWKTAEALAGAWIISQSLKLATQRSRPHTRSVYAFWEGGDSFPSGHATVAWSLAAVSSNHFKEKKWVPWLVYPLAAAVSLSRISSGNHHASDVMVGSVIGFAIGKYVVQ